MSTPPDWTHEVLDLVGEISLGVVTRRLYSASHPRAVRASEALVGRVSEMLEASQRDSMTLIQLEGELFVEGRPFTRMGERVAGLVRHLHRRSVEQVTFFAGVTLEEIDEFLDALAETEGGFPRLEHVSVGRLPDEADAFGGRGGATRPPEVLLRDRLALIAEAFDVVGTGAALPLAQCEDVVREIDLLVNHTDDPMAMLAPLVEPRDWPAVHAHNVTVLSLAIAMALRINTETRRDLGLAALVHDIGKLGEAPALIAREIGENIDECVLYPDHQQRALGLLLPLPELPDAVPVVVLDHHLAVDGSGCVGLPIGRPPHAGARLVACADLLDLLHTARRSRGVVSRDDIAATLQAEVGRRLDPFFAHVLQVVWELDSGARRG